jgi:hypothetical protein
LRPQTRKVGRFARRDPHDDHARHRQLIQRQPAAEPRLEQPAGLLFGIGAHARDTRRGRGQRRSPLHVGLDIAIGRRPYLNRDLARDRGLPFPRRHTHQYHGAERQRGEKRHDRDHGEQRPAGNRVLRHD